MAVYAYEFGDNLYINLTNKCTNNCTFCVRNNGDGICGNNLWLEKEPSAQDVIKQIESNYDLKEYNEVVFCGYGEPTIALPVLKSVAKYLKEQGSRVRINTNGHGNIYHEKNIAKELSGLVDVISISMNADNAKDYDEVCQSIYGEEGFDAMLEFAKECKDYIPHVVLSVVDVLPQEKIEICKEIAKKTGVEFRIRSYVPDYN